MHLQNIFSAALLVILCFSLVESPCAKSKKSSRQKKAAAPAYAPAPATDYFLDDIISGKQTAPAPAEPPPEQPVAAEPSPDPASAPAAEAAPEPDAAVDKSLLTNIVFSEKGIKAFGWGEYKVGGRCLCCDNFLDGDCIVVHSTNRSERVRIKQIVDGNIEADTADKSTYFGDVVERERPELVNMLVAEINLKKNAGYLSGDRLYGRK